jgi:vacuolar protein sorting-associated protein 29
MANFGDLVLVVGDLHIPTRATKIPAPFKRMLVPNKMQHVICTGNVSSEDYEFLLSLSPNLHCTAGDHDDTTGTVTPVFPETRVVQVGAFRIGVVHGHQMIPWKSPEAADRMRRKLNVDILVSGHTHQPEVQSQDGYHHINPV